MNMNDCVPTTTLLFAYHSLLPSSSKGIIDSLGSRTAQTGALLVILTFSRTFSLDLFALAARPLAFIAFRPQGTLPCMMSAFEGGKGAYSKDEKGRMKDSSEESR